MSVFVEAEKFLGHILSTRASASWGKCGSSERAKRKLLQLLSEDKCFDEDL